MLGIGPYGPKDTIPGNLKSGFIGVHPWFPALLSFLKQDSQDFRIHRIPSRGL
jgi:hypothetical protein